ncbi:MULTISPECIES: hypothetical protein [Paenibacillus]|uniref:Uncharacterized protein n=1 Tax=Paenibacillus ottowii TaxID=2315729 RepID=A0ABY3AZU5_9BACL|nr:MULTISPECIES: hypothetical protein [Paenibacillus]KZE67519.1 hypothetical protein AV545_23065 [Paenibacillus jamilae]NEU25683.1 hypothetical protein [Paenibacillus polymyxa]OBA03983.1 hypothetical protein A9P44_19390 [Paenibacillus polymyxa]TQR96935.1 hypothetical protein FKV70_19600 [Paenibacillus ottowii]
MKRKHIYKVHRENEGSLHLPKIIDIKDDVVGSEPKIITWNKVKRRDRSLTQNWQIRLNEHRNGRGDGRL